MPKFSRDTIPTHLSGIDTHLNPSYSLMWGRYSHKAIQTLDYASLALDAFARDCEWAEPLTNDINPETKARHHVDACDFLSMIKPETVAVGLIDPPFSDRQAEKKYETQPIWAEPGYMNSVERMVGEAIVPGGFIIKCGYNTNRPADGFDLVELRICAFGGNRHDMLISIWRKTQSSLRGWTT